MHVCFSLRVRTEPRTDQTTVAKLHRLLKYEANKHLSGQHGLSTFGRTAEQTAQRL